MIEPLNTNDLRAKSVRETVELLYIKLNEVIDELNKREHIPLDYSAKLPSSHPPAP